MFTHQLGLSSASPPPAGHQLSLTSAGHQLSLNIYIYIYTASWASAQPHSWASAQPHSWASAQPQKTAGHQLSLNIYIVVVLIIIIIIISITICFCAVLESIQSCAAAILALVFFKQATPNEFTECNHGWPNIETTSEPGILCAGARFS